MPSLQLERSAGLCSAYCPQGYQVCFLRATSQQGGSPHVMVTEFAALQVKCSALFPVEIYRDRKKKKIKQHWSFLHELMINLTLYRKTLKKKKTKTKTEKTRKSPCLAFVVFFVYQRQKQLFLIKYCLKKNQEASIKEILVNISADFVWFLKISLMRIIVLCKHALFFF